MCVTPAQHLMDKVQGLRVWILETMPQIRHLFAVGLQVELLILGFRFLSEKQVDRTVIVKNKQDDVYKVFIW